MDRSTKGNTTDDSRYRSELAEFPDGLRTLAKIIARRHATRGSGPKDAKDKTSGSGPNLKLTQEETKGEVKLPPAS